MVQRANSEAPSVSGGGGGSSISGGHSQNQRENRMGLGMGYAAYQSGYNKLFTQVRKNWFFFVYFIIIILYIKT